MEENKDLELQEKEQGSDVEVQETGESFGDAGSVCGSIGCCCDPTAEGMPRKSKKPLLIAILAALFVLLALSPVLFGMYQKMQLRNNPDQYFLHALDKDDFKSGMTAEISLDYDYPDQKDLSEFVKQLKFKVDVAAMNENATDNESGVSGKYSLFYKDKLMLDADFSISKNLMEIRFLGESIIFENFSNFDPKRAENLRFDKVKSDQEIRDIIMKLFSKIALKETDVKDPVLNQTADVLEYEFTLHELYTAIKELVMIMDTNVALKEFVSDIALQITDEMQKQPGVDAAEIESFREQVKSGAFIKEIQDQVKEIDANIGMVFAFVEANVKGDMYLNEKGIQGGNYGVIVRVPDFATGEKVKIHLHYSVFKNNLKTEGAIEKKSNSFVVDFSQEENNYIQYEKLGRVISNKLLEKPEIKELLEDLNKLEGGSDLINSFF